MMNIMILMFAMLCKVYYSYYMMKLLFFSMVFSCFLKSNNFFVILLSLEMGILGFFLVMVFEPPQKFILIVFLFILSSILGLIIFLISMKKFNNFFVASFYF